MAQRHNAWLSGIMGVVVGDALGCPVQFETRNEVARHPVTGMRGNGTFRLPAGSWTDDSSMTLALAESIRRTSTIDYTDIMENFVKWYSGGEFTPFGYAYDIGITTGEAIRDYIRNKDPFTCGRNGVYNCGNGSLMRILPACLYCIGQGLSNEDAIEIIHKVGSLTHAYIRANIACGLYYFMIKEIQTTDSSRSLPELLQEGLTKGFDFYETWFSNPDHCETSSKNLFELNN